MLLILLLFIGSASFQPAVPTVCHLPAGKTGYQVPISSCPYLITLIHSLQKPLPQEVSKFIKTTFFHHSQDKVVLVCCPREGLVSGVRERTSSVPDLYQGDCKHQINVASSCIPYNECSPFAGLLSNLRKPIDPAVGSLVRSSLLCGFTPNIGNLVPNVCCPLGSLLHDSSLEYETPLHTTQDLKTHPGNQQLASSEACGISAVLERSNNDWSNAKLGQHPWLVILAYKEGTETRFKCGGVLIGKIYVLTVASCITKNLVSVRVGELDLGSQIDCEKSWCGDQPQDIDVEMIVKDINELAVIKLASNISENDFVSPICIKQSQEKNQPLASEVTSFGLSRGIRHRKLKFLQQSTSFLEVCTNHTVCSPIQESSCPSADVGGGLYTNIPNMYGDQWYVDGLFVTSPGKCGTVIRLEDKIKWILDTVHKLHRKSVLK